MVSRSKQPAGAPILHLPVRRPHNLPAQPTFLIGRERELDAVPALLRRPDVRLVTLTGAPGTGKTRLAVEVAGRLVQEMIHGACFVDLAPLREPNLVAATIARTLGVREAGRQPLLERLTHELRDKHLLLVLDNFEQLLAAAPQVAALLAACPELTVLATSRAPLHLRWEHEFPVAPLQLPNLEHLPAPSVLAGIPAVALFVARARAIQPDFELSEQNGPAVAAICVRLDGLPLAIELAAAHSKVYPPHAIIARLLRRLDLLTGGPLDLPARQRTLRSAIAWSYDLLTLEEQRLLRRLSVFAGGCTLSAAEAVFGALGDKHLSVADVLASLVGRSLLQLEKPHHGGESQRSQRYPDGEPRYRMLETILEYGREQLEASGEAAAGRRRHLEVFLALAEAAAGQLEGPQQVAALNRLEAEHDNLRAALRHALQDGEPEVALRLAVALWRFWYIHGYLGEGRAWLGAALAAGEGRGDPALRAAALYRVACLAWAQGDYPTARVAGEQSAAMGHALGDKRMLALALDVLGVVASSEGDHAAGRALLEESIALLRAEGYGWGLGRSLNNLASVVLAEGEHGLARSLYSQSLEILRPVGDPYQLIPPLMGLAFQHGQQGEYGRAIAHFRECLTALQDLQGKWFISRCIEGLAGVLALQGRHERAALLFGAGEALREATGTPVLAIYRAQYDRGLAAARAALGEERCARAWAEGRALSLDEVIAYALQDNDGHMVDCQVPAGHRGAEEDGAGRAEAHPSSFPGNLTAREIEVLRLLACGRTNKEIAEQLVLSVRTVENHAARLYGKIGARGRADATTYALRHGLI